MSAEVAPLQVRSTVFIPPHLHFAAGPHCRVNVPRSGRAGGAGGYAAVGARVVSPAGVPKQVVKSLRGLYQSHVIDVDRRCFANIDRDFDDYLYSMEGEPEFRPIGRRDGIKGYRVRSAIPVIDGGVCGAGNIAVGLGPELK